MQNFVKCRFCDKSHALCPVNRINSPKYFMIKLLNNVWPSIAELDVYYVLEIFHRLFLICITKLSKAIFACLSKKTSRNHKNFPVSNLKEPQITERNSFEGITID